MNSAIGVYVKLFFSDPTVFIRIISECDIRDGCGLEFGAESLDFTRNFSLQGVYIGWAGRVFLRAGCGG